MNKILGKVLKYLPFNTKKGEEANKDYVKGQNKNVTTPYMDIVVKRLQGDTPVQIAKFRAIQNKDRSFNMKVVSEEFDFKDELELAKNKIIDHLTYKLDLVDMPEGLSAKEIKEKKLEIVRKKIKEQEKIVKEIELKADSNDFNEIKDNVHDEDYRLHTLKVLEYTIENEGKGSFEEINLDGFRQRTYLLKDGLFIPYFHNSKNVSLYPYQAINRKTYRDNQDMIDRDFVDENTSKYGNMFNNFLKIAVIVLLMLNVWAFMENQATAMELSDQATNSDWAQIVNSAEGSSILCAEYLANQVQSNDKLIKYATDYLINESVKEKEGDSISLE